jgi:hypothetical protein
VVRYAKVDIQPQTAGGIFNFDNCACNPSTITPSTPFYDTVQEEGTSLAQRHRLNFIGVGVTATDDAANSRTNVTISAGGTWGTITGTLSNQTDLQAALNAKVAANGAIVGATKTKITFDAKGLVTGGADASYADITGLPGADKQVLFNDGGALAGSSKFLFDKATGNVRIGSFAGYDPFFDDPASFYDSSILAPLNSAQLSALGVEAQTNTSFKRAIETAVMVTGASPEGAEGVSAHVGSKASSGPTSELTGFDASMSNQSTGNVVRMEGYYSELLNTGGGTIGSAFGYYHNGTAPATNNYAFYTETMGSGAGSYAYYSAGGKNFFAQGTNGLDVLTLKRATDSGPTGNFENFKNAADVALWTVDITGSLAAGTVPGERVSGNIAGNAATATALAADPADCSGNNFALGINVSGVAQCAQPAFSNLSGSAIKGQLPGTTVYTDQANTFGAFLQKFKAGSNFALADPTDGTKLAQFDVSNIATGTTRTVNVPNANSTTVQSDTGASNNFLTAISAQGVISKAQPSFSNISGSLADGQLSANVALYNNADKTWGAGVAFCWTFDGGANTDPTFCPTSGTTPQISTNSIFLIPDGTVGAPALAFSSQPATGMYKRAASTITWSLNNSADMELGRGTNTTLALPLNGQLAFSNTSNDARTTLATFITNVTAATIALGSFDLNGAPVAQTLQVQNAITGTDLAGAAQFRIIGPKGTGAGATSPLIIAVGGKQATGATAHATTDLEKWIGGTVADPAQDEACFLGTHGEQWCRGSMTELLTLSTSGTTTDTTNNLLPVDAIIESVVVRITTTITTATNWSVGDGTTAARFCSSNATLTAGTTSTCLNHQKGGVATDAAGPTQTAAAKVRITTTGTPGAGVIRITVFYRRMIPPTS